MPPAFGSVIRAAGQAQGVGSDALEALRTVYLGKDPTRRLWVGMVAKKGAEGALSALQNYATTLSVVAALMATIAIASLAEPPEPAAGRTNADDFGTDSGPMVAFALLEMTSFVLTLSATLLTVILYVMVDHLPANEEAVIAYLDANGPMLALFPLPLLGGIVALLGGEAIRLLVVYGAGIAAAGIFIGASSFLIMLFVYVRMQNQASFLSYAYAKSVLPGESIAPASNFMTGLPADLSLGSGSGGASGEGVGVELA